jgi:hypothetical protein
MTSDDAFAVLNQYNDRLPQSTPSFGAEISVRRIDALDAGALRYALELVATLDLYRSALGSVKGVFAAA